MKEQKRHNCKHKEWHVFITYFSVKLKGYYNIFVTSIPDTGASTWHRTRAATTMLLNLATISWRGKNPACQSFLWQYLLLHWSSWLVLPKNTNSHTWRSRFIVWSLTYNWWAAEDYEPPSTVALHQHSAQMTLDKKKKIDEKWSIYKQLICVLLCAIC